jgi:DNA-directed RNA polymerase sigma subunit (sigma70/sigma32)
VIRLLYGSDGDRDPQTFKAIGQHLGIDPDQVGGIEERGLKELALRRELDALREAA